MILNGKVAIVTGGGRGIGRAIALAFANEGASVVVADIDREAANQVADEIRAIGRRCVPVVVDVSKTHEVQMMVRAAVDELGRIDILVNNAGILGKRQPFSQSTEDDWDPVLKTNLIGVFKCTLEALKHMIRAKTGRIVNIASCAGLEGDPMEPIYATTKAGVISFTKSLASELAEHNINVNSIAPGLIKTGMSRDIPDDQMEAYIRTIPLRRLGLPEDVASATVFLASDSANYITGQTIIVSGGRSMRP